ncbi:MAG: glutamate synthase large subunit [Alphaproteobacteria bacterium]|nr:glutamate synthase large subunit [Alphaproteobacteria bacterium]
MTGFPEETGLYRPEDEHDSCGVGFVASIDGRPRREVVWAAINALENVWHRGAIDADGKTGDGAGLMVAVPQEFFHDHAVRTGHRAKKDMIGVGQVFLPRVNLEAQEAARAITETEILKFGYVIYGWRQVPIDISVIGEKAARTRPEIEQVMIGNNGKDEETFERELYIIRRRIEKRVKAAGIADYYICSLSSRQIIYKGLFLAEQISKFYPDLRDNRFESNFAIFHQRYSTNTFPTWHLAQPFRCLAHNGEINTLSGNLNWMKVHETKMNHPVFGEHMDDLKPVVLAGGSDSAALDNVFELMCRAGRDAPMVKSMLVPEAYLTDATMPPEHKAFYMYCNTVMEPWDGPAALAMTDGRWLVGGMDRNGLRPFRYTITEDGLIVAGSETGMVALDETRLVEKGRIGPGEMIAIDLAEGRLYKDRAIKDMLAARQPYSEWVAHGKWLEQTMKEAAEKEEAALTRDQRCRLQMAVGHTIEDIDLILKPMVNDAKEAIGSMGDDTPLAVLSHHYRGMHHFFRQNFSQVTNPPIDSLREKRVMSLYTRLGNLGNILGEAREQCQMLAVRSPVITNAELAALREFLGKGVSEIDTTFPADGEPDALRNALARIRLEAEKAVRAGRGHLILTDENVSADCAPIPAILAAGAVHTHLVREGLRSDATITVRTAECMDTHHFAVLIGVGATLVNAWLTQEAIEAERQRGIFGDKCLSECMANYKKAIGEGLLKIMSKMGISVISSYRGGSCFEAIGLSRSLVAEYLPTVPSRISGIGLTGLQDKVLSAHRAAFRAEGASMLPVGGFYRYRNGGERHGWEAQAIHLLQKACNSGDYRLYKRFSELHHTRAPVNIRDLLGFDTNRQQVPLHEVESVVQIRKRFVTPAMSLGALSPEAHGTLSVAMNRIGGKSDSGEGGEDPARYKLDRDGDDWNSAIKQVASGRFGVTAEYLNKCEEIEIKVAQGAKPGEGGQLPGFKVTEMIARFRHSTPGVTLISPPPHHDIYSIEDLAQLIYDLKQINPVAKVCVKLVARTGIGTIAAGVAKANADVILVSGNSGGTGASPQTSIKFAGVPWELGLSEVHQVLTMNGLRHRVKLRTDGGIKTGRDIVIAAILGAEEYGIGTASLIAMGCLMVRQCHSNTCPVGVCTQDDELRKRFMGTPDKVVNLMSFLAEEVREHLARLGYSTLEEIVGRTELLYQVSHGASTLDDLDLNPLLVQADPMSNQMTCQLGDRRNEVPDTLDARIAAEARPLFDRKQKVTLACDVQNVHRAVGTRLSSMITRKFGQDALPDGFLTIRLTGSAGQSLGAFVCSGMRIEVYGDANDYVGKGLSGGTIILRPPPGSPLKSHENTIIGNTVLYGATSGKLLAAGQAGERFAVRNSGAQVVVEGCSSNGCEYMTGGVAVILGAVGPNFAAGMTGGLAFVYDPDERLPVNINADSVVFDRIGSDYYEEMLKGLVAEHAAETGSAWSAGILSNWTNVRRQFWHVVPKEILGKLDVKPFEARVASAAE